MDNTGSNVPTKSSEGLKEEPLGLAARNDLEQNELSHQEDCHPSQEAWRIRKFLSQQLDSGSHHLSHNPGSRSLPPQLVALLP